MFLHFPIGISSLLAMVNYLKQMRNKKEVIKTDEPVGEQGYYVAEATSECHSSCYDKETDCPSQFHYDESQWGDLSEKQEVGLEK